MSFFDLHCFSRQVNETAFNHDCLFEMKTLMENTQLEELKNIADVLQGFVPLLYLS